MSISPLSPLPDLERRARELYRSYSPALGEPSILVTPSWYDDLFLFTLANRYRPAFWTPTNVRVFYPTPDLTGSRTAARSPTAAPSAMYAASNLGKKSASSAAADHAQRKLEKAISRLGIFALAIAGTVTIFLVGRGLYRHKVGLNKDQKEAEYIGRLLNEGFYDKHFGSDNRAKEAAKKLIDHEISILKIYSSRFTTVVSTSLGFLIGTSALLGGHYYPEYTPSADKTALVGEGILYASIVWGAWRFIREWDNSNKMSLLQKEIVGDRYTPGLALEIVSGLTKKRVKKETLPLAATVAPSSTTPTTQTPSTTLTTQSA